MVQQRTHLFTTTQCTAVFPAPKACNLTVRERDALVFTTTKGTTVFPAPKACNLTLTLTPRRIAFMYYCTTVFNCTFVPNMVFHCPVALQVTDLDLGVADLETRGELCIRGNIGRVLLLHSFFMCRATHASSPFLPGRVFAFPRAAATPSRSKGTKPRGLGRE